MELWLQQHVASTALIASTLGLGSLGLSILVSWITYWVLYIVSFYITTFSLQLSHETLLWTSGALLMLLFYGSYTTSREYLEEFSFSTGTATNRIVSVYLPRVGMASNINPLAPDSFHSIVKLITTVLYIGPGLFFWGLRSVRKASAIRRVDARECAGVVAALFHENRKVRFDELPRLAPSSNLETALRDLRTIGALIFLTNDPPGLMLDAMFRDKVITAISTS